MGTLEIQDNSVWVKHIEGDPSLKAHILALQPEETIDLEVDGIVGRWQKMSLGKDGRPTFGIKPIGDMKTVWTNMLKRKGKRVEVREVVSADTYLASLTSHLSEWDSAQDERAYGGL